MLPTPALSPVVIESESAQSRLRRTVAGILITFQFEFILENGLWKIEEF